VIGAGTPSPKASTVAPGRAPAMLPPVAWVWPKKSAGPATRPVTLDVTRHAARHVMTPEHKNLSALHTPKGHALTPVFSHGASILAHGEKRAV
jgi:hypothetical protein